MTDKEFLDLLMSYKAGKVPLKDVGVALANNQFGHEYIALAGNILAAEREQGKAVNPKPVSREENKPLFEFGSGGVQGQVI